MFQKKSLGQNFLKSPKIIGDIVLASGVKTSDNVLEIGPGDGILTKELLKTGANVVTVEKDDRLIPILSEKFSKEISSGQLKIIHADILDLDIDSLVLSDLSAVRGDSEACDQTVLMYSAGTNGAVNKEMREIWKYKLVANIPYYITGQLIRIFLESNNQPESMTLLLQKEVAERIVAKNKKESLLSLSVKAYGVPKYIRTVGRGAFTPSPNVDSAIIHISGISKKNFESVSEEKFFEILHLGFAHKRKQLLPNLSEKYPREKITEVFEKIGLDSKCRAEDIAIDTWIRLCLELK